MTTDLPWAGSIRRRLRQLLGAGPPRITAAVASLTGARNENQDNYLILADGRAELLRNGEPVEMVIPNWPRQRVRLAVLDGMGGHRDGRQVAEAAAQRVAGIPPQYDAVTLRQSVLNLHRQLLRQFARPQDPANPGATVVWAELDRYSGRGWLAHVGDSRAYLLRDGRWHSLTHDHCLAEFNWRDGDLGDREYRRLTMLGDKRIAQALAYGSWGIRTDDRGIKPYAHSPDLRLDLAAELVGELAEHADIRPLRLACGDRLLLATDGLWDASANGGWQGPVSVGWIADGANQFAQAAIDHGSRDNVTVLLAGSDDGEGARDS